MSLLRINHRPAPRQLLVFALTWLAFCAVAGWTQWTGGRAEVAYLCWTLAVVVPVAGAFWREGLRLFYVGLCYATFPFGFVVSTLVLAVIYYAVLTPIGLLLRVCGHDALQRRAAASHWHRRPAPRKAVDYFRPH